MYAMIVALLLLVNSSQTQPDAGSEKAGIHKRPAQQKTDGEKENRPQTIFAVQEIQPENKQPNPYDASKDSLYRAYLTFTILGVCGGIIGLGLLYKQFVATKLAAEAAKESADVASETIEVYKLMMRPWVYETLSIPENKMIPKGKYIVGKLFFGLDLTISNEVPHPAWVTQVEARFHCVPSLDNLPPTPEFLKDNLTVYPGKGMIVTRDAPPIEIFIKSDSGSAADFSERMYNQHWIACVYGLIKYRGMFDDLDVIHETGFLYASKGPVTWERSAYPPAYTKHT